MRPVSVREDGGDEFIVKHVGEGTMAKVMAETSDFDAFYVVIVNTKVRLAMA
jgi:hypothetical protein